MLVGSYARGTAVHGLSDLDLLVVGGEPPAHDAAVHMVAITPDRLAARVAEGDDFAVWALRFGIPVTGRRYWQELRERLLPGAPWPDPVRKLRQAAPRLKAAADLLAMGDIDAAHYELRFAAALVARALLLAAGAFPLSRPELPDQIEPIDARVAMWLRRLNEQQPPDAADLALALDHVRGAAADLGTLPAG